MAVVDSAGSDSASTSSSSNDWFYNDYLSRSTGAGSNLRFYQFGLPRVGSKVSCNVMDLDFDQFGNMTDVGLCKSAF